MSSADLVAIGDIHGCRQELETLLSQLPINRDSVLVFLGDYVDRGPDSRGVIDTLLELKKRHSTIYLKGNHENMFLDFIKDPKCAAAAYFVFNGGSATLASYASTKGEIHLPAEHLSFLRGLRLFYEVPGYFFVHAGVPPNKSLEEVKANTNEFEEQMLWIRSPFLKSSHVWEKMIVHGHSVVASVEIRENRINLDTGCVFGGKLTAMSVRPRTVYSVDKINPVEPKFLREEGSRRIAVRFDGSFAVEVPTVSGVLNFEAVNYNNFGMLIRNRQIALTNLKEGDTIDGTLQFQNRPMAFKAKIVRSYTADGFHYFALKMTDPIFGRQID